MRFLKWLFLILTVLILVVGVAAYVFLQNFDLNKYKGMTEKIVYEQTGRKLSIAGNADLGVSLIPTVVLNDISFANPEWAKNQQMATVKTLELKIALLPLISKQVIIDKVILKSPQIWLETSKDGKNSWDIELKPQENSQPKTSWIIKSAYAQENSSPLAGISELSLKEVLIDNGEVNYYTHKDNSNLNLKIKNIALSGEGMNAPVNLVWDVSYNGLDIAGKGDFGSISALLSGKSEYPVSMDVKALGIKAVVNAKIKNLLGDKLNASFDYNIYNPAGNMNAPETTLIGTGTANLQSFALDIKELNIVKNIIKGKVNADISGKLPSVKADLNSEKFDVGVFNRNSPTAWHFEIIKSAHASNLIPNDRIPFELLQKLNADVNLKIAQLIVNPELRLNNVLVSAVLNKGILNVNKLFFNIKDGTVDLTAQANALKKSLAVKGKSENVLLTEVAPVLNYAGDGKFGIVSGGITQTYFDLKGEGATYRALADTLNGELVAVAEKTKLKSGKLKILANSFITQLLNVLNINTEKAEDAELQCAVVRGDFVNGKINFKKGIAVDTDKIDVVGNGTLNLHNDKIDISINAYRDSLADVSVMQALTNLFKIKGTLQSPSIAIDQNNALKAIAGVALTGGVSAGAQLLLDKDAAPCYTALEGSIYKDKFAKPTGVANAAQKTYQGASDMVNDSVNMVKSGAKDIKNSAKGLLNNILPTTKKDK